MDGSQVDIQTCFACPVQISGDGIVMDAEFTERMLKFHRKVNPKEGLIGFYKTGTDIDQNTLELYQYYLKLLKDTKNKCLVPQPLLFLIDPTMTNNRLTIKVLSFFTAPQVRKSEWTDKNDDEWKHIDQVRIFAECPYRIAMAEFEKTGLDVIFYGQEHYDTMAIVSERQQPRQEDIGQLLAEQKLLSNKELLSRNFDEVIANLDECDSFIQKIIENGGDGDSELARLMDECLGQFSTDDMALLEQMVASNFEDALMIGSLAKLQQHQLVISGQLNSIFADSIRTNSSLTLSKKQASKQEGAK